MYFKIKKSFSKLLFYINNCTIYNTLFSCLQTFIFILNEVYYEIS